MNGEPAYVDTAKEEQTPMGKVESALDTMNSCATSLEELIMSCHTRLLGEFQFNPREDVDLPDGPGQLSSIVVQVNTPRRTIQRCIEAMESMDQNIS